MIEDLRESCLGEEFDYLYLMSSLKEYKQPRAVVTRLLKSGAIIRVKKGIYVFGQKYRRQSISRPILANLIYGPSYVSQEFALSHYGMIPERVEVVTCMTTQKNKLYHTPLGAFCYQHLHPRKFTVGIIRESIDQNRHFLIASREKALADTIAFERSLKTKNELFVHLTNNLRIETDDLNRLNLDLLTTISQAYNCPVVRLLKELIKGGI